MIAAYRRATNGGPARCLYTPTCSEYAELAIVRFGVARGGILAWRRYRACRLPSATARSR
jgi:putative component of membrane protein insertase Oxa1/YidC/SpoIIIJ protein YidD